MVSIVAGPSYGIAHIDAIRDDSAYLSGHIFARLERETEFEPFIDVDSIQLGANISAVIDDRVAKCDVCSRSLDPNGLTSLTRRDVAGPTDPPDFVLKEITTAMHRGIPVIPILVDAAEFPNAGQLPKDLGELSLYNRFRIQHNSFDSDMSRLIQRLNCSSARLQSCIRELHEFDPKVEGIPRAEALEKWIGDSLSKVFAYSKPLYDRYKDAADLQTKEAKRTLRAIKRGRKYISTATGRVLSPVDYLAKGKEQSDRLLQEAIDTFEGRNRQR